MNDIFEKINKTISDTSKVVTEKTKMVGEVAKLNAKIISSERSISDNYTLLGKMYYDSCKENPSEETAETVNAITASIDAIAEMKAQILSIKGAVKCTNCGAECPIENSFCGKCGAPLEKPEPPVEEEVPADVIPVNAEEIVDDEVPAEDTAVSEEAAENKAEDKTEE